MTTTQIVRRLAALVAAVASFALCAAPTAAYASEPEAVAYYADTTVDTYGDAVMNAALDWSDASQLILLPLTDCALAGSAMCISIVVVDAFATQDGQAAEMDATDPLRPIIRLSHHYVIGSRGFTWRTRRHLACHEIGHALHVDHNNARGCMHETNSPEAHRYRAQRYPGMRNLALAYV